MFSHFSKQSFKEDLVSINIILLYKFPTNEQTAIKSKGNITNALKSMLNKKRDELFIWSYLQIKWTCIKASFNYCKNQEYRHTIRKKAKKKYNLIKAS